MEHKIVMIPIEELVPGIKESAKEIARRDATRCPYRGMEVDG